MSRALLYVLALSLAHLAEAGAPPLESRLVGRDAGADRAFNARQVAPYLEAVEELLGLGVPGEVAIYTYHGPEEIAARLGIYTSGVAFPLSRQIHLTDKLRPDHVVRVVAGQAGQVGSFFETGLVIALGARGRWQGRAVDEVVRARGLDAEALLATVDDFARRSPAAVGPIAGSFVAFLLERHGGPAFTRLLRLVRSATDPDLACQAAFGRSLPDEARAWARELRVGPMPRAHRLVFGAGGAWGLPRLLPATRTPVPQPADLLASAP